MTATITGPAQPARTAQDVAQWVPVCRADDLVPEQGVAALLPDLTQVAVVRTFTGELYAVSNIDPFTGAGVLARGIVGDRGGVPVLVSPLHKQAFDLSTGVCLDDQNVVLDTYPVRVVDGMVQVGLA
ncbi:nitrite reductase small subunit NirD [Goodfellowiella coeruleoviolacea]|nr:nitrite reductase small subunit NirD [Goodfellowiella coeruleoviolacea]